MNSVEKNQHAFPKHESESKTTRVCLHCNGPFKDGVGYITGGALLLDESEESSIHSKRQRAFFNVGFHGKKPDMSDSADIQIVDDLPGGQFDLSFCTLACLKSWFIDIIEKLQAQIARDVRESN